MPSGECSARVPEWGSHGEYSATEWGFNAEWRVQYQCHRVGFPRRVASTVPVSQSGIPRRVQCQCPRVGFPCRVASTVPVSQSWVPMPSGEYSASITGWGSHAEWRVQCQCHRVGFPCRVESTVPE
ncbi:hypothetical protein NDU88_000187 [Pleurodeles waltl]|uniref:Uncharacterized protein n=1 Tax=Pleurodeles waltl TaxID=8319 RepID=A0AAV7P397_PLEWA|nr:hypothetical protein NDU88_000187 [Pleurodeles waltl]